MPVGFTGYNWRTPTPDDYAGWSFRFPEGNAAIHTGDRLVGFDKDCYDDKTGAQAMVEGEKRWGPLLPTWSSGSRDDGSGIFWYQVPGRHPPGQRDHVPRSRLPPRRGHPVLPHGYAAVWPSIHPDTGQMYVWRNPDGAVVDPSIPRPYVDFPLLADGWLEGLKKPVPRHRQRVRLVRRVVF